MQAKNILSAELFPLKPSDRCSKALELMNEWEVCQLPVVHHDKVLGMVSAEDLAFPAEPQDTVKKYMRDNTICKTGRNHHMLDLFKLMADTGLSSIAVVNEEDHFMGIVDMKDVVKYIAQFYGFSASGSIITLEMAARDFSLSEIGRLVESNNSQILGLFIKPLGDSDNRIELTMRVNRTDIRPLIATFSRYNYEVVILEGMNKEDIDSLKDRYDSFMKYLNT
jgi:acetoin utilization protein AcuB